jgi:hypothetical protein
VLLLCTGAGFSADSGLAVYKDVADVPAYKERKLDYADICVPGSLFDMDTFCLNCMRVGWIEQDPDLFYGFWCFYFLLYNLHIMCHHLKTLGGSASTTTAIRGRIPATPSSNGQSGKAHLQLTLKRRWKDDYFRSGGAVTQPFFSYTSNVDAHFFRAGFNQYEVHEIHGNCETWQCSNKQCKREPEIWMAPPGFRFTVTGGMASDHVPPASPAVPPAKGRTELGFPIAPDQPKPTQTEAKQAKSKQGKPSHPTPSKPLQSKTAPTKSSPKLNQAKSQSHPSKQIQPKSTQTKLSPPKHPTSSQLQSSPEATAAPASDPDADVVDHRSELCRGFDSQRPTCRCGAPARPNILMFQDGMDPLWPPYGPPMDPYASRQLQSFAEHRVRRMDAVAQG